MNVSRKHVFFFLCVLLLTNAVRSQEPNYELEWDLSSLYQNTEAWRKDIALMREHMEQIKGFRGKLSSTPEELLAALRAYQDMMKIAYKVFRYPSLQLSLNVRNTEARVMQQEISVLWRAFSREIVWWDNEILSNGYEKLQEWQKNVPALQEFGFMFTSMFHSQKFYLDDEKEALLRNFSPLYGTPAQIYSALTTADITFPTIRLTNGEEMHLTRLNRSRIYADPQFTKEDRLQAQEAMMNVYLTNKHTYAVILENVYRHRWAFAQARGYSSMLEQALWGNDIPEDVYLNLIRTVRQNTKPLQRYSALKKKYLSRIYELDEYHSVDGGLPFIREFKEYPYHEAKVWVYNSVGPLGREYQEKFKTMLQPGRIDVYERDGKESGAFMSNVYGVHPFILMNYTNRLSSVYTLAHELGHALHSILSDETQPFTTHSYSIFIAEIAAIFNEALLTDYLTKKFPNPEDRILILRTAIEKISGTFYFQTLLADFEYQLAKLIENNQPVNIDVLTQIMAELEDDYYGDVVKRNEAFRGMSWMQVDHLYSRPFYVYQYATSYAGAAHFYKQITTGSRRSREQALQRYMTLLRSGGNDFPINQLQKAGVDMRDTRVVMAVIEQMDMLVNQLERELKRYFKF